MRRVKNASPLNGRFEKLDSFSESVLSILTWEHYHGVSCEQMPVDVGG